MDVGELPKICVCGMSEGHKGECSEYIVGADWSLDKAKNEERYKSLSMAVGNGHNLIAISEFDRQRHTNTKPNRYLFLVTKPGVDDTHICVVLDAPDIHALIGILQETIDIEPFEE